MGTISACDVQVRMAYTVMSRVDRSKTSLPYLVLDDETSNCHIARPPSSRGRGRG